MLHEESSPADIIPLPPLPLITSIAEVSGGFPLPPFEHIEPSLEPPRSASSAVRHQGFPLRSTLL